METGEKATDDNGNLQDNLEDLTVPEEQAEEAKGGDYNTWRTNFGRTS